MSSIKHTVQLSLYPSTISSLSLLFSLCHPPIHTLLSFAHTCENSRAQNSRILIKCCQVKEVSKLPHDEQKLPRASPLLHLLPLHPPFPPTTMPVICWHQLLPGPLLHIIYVTFAGWHNFASAFAFAFDFTYSGVFTFTWHLASALSVCLSVLLSVYLSRSRSMVRCTLLSLSLCLSRSQSVSQSVTLSSKSSQAGGSYCCR